MVPEEGSLSADSALVELVTYRSGALLRTAFLLTGSRTDAEDLLQDALIRVFRRRHGVRDLSVLESYVRTTLVRAHIDAQRRRSSRELPVSSVPDRGEPWSPDIGVPWRDDTWSATMRLPARQRAVVVLTYYEDLAERQVAETLGCSVGAVKSHRARALAALRAELAPLAAALGGEER